MAEPEVVAELKQILGALIFCAKQPLTLKDMRRCLVEVAEREKGDAAVFAEATPSQLRDALEELVRDLDRSHAGFVIREVAGGYRVQSDDACGRWVRHLLRAGKPTRLSPPALETLAIVAYRQPLSRADIEAVRGVNVDHVIRSLLELQLLRIAGRSDLPGRPLLYGTTQRFLEHFGLRDIKELAEIEPMLLAQREKEASACLARPAQPELIAVDAPGESGGVEGGDAGAGEDEDGEEEESVFEDESGESTGEEEKSAVNDMDGADEDNREEYEEEEATSEDEEEEGDDEAFDDEDDEEYEEDEDDDEDEDDERA